MVRKATEAKSGKMPEQAKKKPRPTRKGRPREDASHVPQGVRELFELMLPNIRKCRPTTICCAAIGLDHNLWEGYCARYPALVLATKRERAPRLMELQDIVESGAQGWQAASRALESLDGENWNRNVRAASGTKANPLSRAMSRGKK